MWDMGRETFLGARMKVAVITEIVAEVEVVIGEETGVAAEMTLGTEIETITVTGIGIAIETEIEIETWTGTEIETGTETGIETEIGIDIERGVEVVDTETHVIDFIHPDVHGDNAPETNIITNMEMYILLLNKPFCFFCDNIY